MAVTVNTKKQREWVMELLKANGWHGDALHVRRVVLDINRHQVPVMYIEQYVDSATYEIRSVPLGAEVVASPGDPTLRAACAAAHDELTRLKREGVQDVSEDVLTATALESCCGRASNCDCKTANETVSPENGQ